MSLQHISALARGLKQADPHDQVVRKASLARIEELRALLDKAGCTELVCCLDAAATLIRLFMSDEGPKNPELMEVVAKLVEAVDSAFNYDSPHAQKVRASMGDGLTIQGAPGVATNEVPTAPEANRASEQAAAQPPHPPQLGKPSKDPGASLSLKGTPQAQTSKPTGSAPVAAGRPAPAPTGRAVAKSDQDAGSLPMLNDMILGELMIQLGHISRQQLNEGLDRQAAKGGRLGQALIDMNVTSWDVIENVLRFQRMLNPEGSVNEGVDESKESHPRNHREIPNLLGEVVVHLRFATQEQVEEAVRVHKATGIRLGEALVQIEALTWPQLRESLRVQHNMRYAAGHAAVTSPKFDLPASSKSGLKLD